MDFLHVITRISVEWMFYCLAEGTLLALLAWLLLRLLPRQNAGTRFALWFSVLLAMIVLPFLAGTSFRRSLTTSFSKPAIGTSTTGMASGHSLMTLPNSVAFSIFAVWLLIAAAALVRLAAGLWQVRRIRKASSEIDLAGLGLEVREIVEKFPRTVSLRVSDCVQVPAALGFFKPAVVIPEWFLREISQAELKQVLLHELAHLQRWDDWTNLAQKIIKALLFFHPSVLWVEQRLSLEREMACDDAVLAQSATPQVYAQCLTRLAEKTLIRKTRKQIALAQAALTRMRQLSLRVAQILDANRPNTTRLWKPAVPLVLAVATLCGLSAWSAPVLLTFKDDPPAPKHEQPGLVVSREANVAVRSSVAQPRLVMVNAALNRGATQQAAVSRVVKSNRRFLSALGMTKSDSRFLPFGKLRVGVTKAQKPAGDYVVQSEQFIVTMTSEPGSGYPQTWQVHMWQVRVLVPADNHAGKTVSRKNI